MKPITIIPAEEAKARSIQKKYARELQVANDVLEKISLKIGSAIDRGEFSTSVTFNPNLVGDIGYASIKSGLESLGYSISTRATGDNNDTMMNVITITW